MDSDIANCISEYPWWGIFPPSVQVPYYQPIQWTITTPPSECAGDVHVFPCPHCQRCKCGAALKATQPEGTAA